MAMRSAIAHSGEDLRGNAETYPWIAGVGREFTARAVRERRNNKDHDPAQPAVAATECCAFTATTTTDASSGPRNQARSETESQLR